MNKKIVMSKDDFEKLNRMVQDMIYSGSNNVELEKFYEELENAEIKDNDKLPEELVTLNSEVELVDTKSGECICKRIVLPPANYEQQELSVITPIGMAVIGRKAGDIIECKVPAGTRVLKVKNILNPVVESGFI
jgi:regulator of nucleoside diphosphate kinase